MHRSARAASALNRSENKTKNHDFGRSFGLFLDRKYPIGFIALSQNQSENETKNHDFGRNWTRLTHEIGRVLNQCYVYALSQNQSENETKNHDFGGNWTRFEPMLCI